MQYLQAASSNLHIRSHPSPGHRRAGLVLALVLCHILPGLAQPPGQSRPPAGNGRRKLQAHRLNQPIELDGRVEEEVWKSMEPGDDFIQQSPQEGQAASEKTEVRLAYDDQALYIAVICFDKEPDKILVTQNKRDGDLLDSDAFLILLDTFGDRQNGFVFGSNPRGMEYDGQVSKAGQSGGVSMPSRGSPPSTSQVTTSGTVVPKGTNRYSRSGTTSFNLNWDGVWTVRAQITARGWEAEFAIPFKTLRFNASNGTHWGVNFMRNIRRRNEQDYWSPIPRVFDLFRVSLAGELEGIEPKLHRSAQFIPYVLGGVDQNFLNKDNPTGSSPPGRT